MALVHHWLLCTITLILTSLAGRAVAFSSGYHINGDASSAATGELTIPLIVNDGKHDLFGKTIQRLTVYVKYEHKERLHVKIVDMGERMQRAVPLSPSSAGIPVADANMEFQYDREQFGFRIVRTDGEVLFDTRGFPFVFEDQYLELTTRLPYNANIYGLGQTSAPFRKHKVQGGEEWVFIDNALIELKNTTTIFASGEPTEFYRNGYGHYPFYLEIRRGKAHGVLMYNAHGMDISLNSDSMTYKMIGGVMDMYFFAPSAGTPNSVVEGYTTLVGKPAMMALWTLGWHQSRYGFKDIDEVEHVVRRYEDHHIPLETIWLDIDYMDRYRGFTLNPVTFPESRVIPFSQRLHSRHQHLVTIIEPSIATHTDYAPYIRGQQLDTFIRNADGTEYNGLVWPGYTAFLDTWHPNASVFWQELIVPWMRKLGADGLWVDMNEPYSFCIGSCGSGKQDSPLTYDDLRAATSTAEAKAEQAAALDAMSQGSHHLLHPKYSIHSFFGDLSEQTVAMSALHYDNIPHYHLHSMYSHTEVALTHQAMLSYSPNERPFILSRSGFVGTGAKAAVWTGDNGSVWPMLKVSLADILNLQLFGVTMAGGDICGFKYNATEELCTRWHALGAFYPFARNHNANNVRDQYPFDWDSTATVTRKALSIRYSLLPYYYTLMEIGHRVGTGLWRPLVFEYPHIDAFLDNDHQVLVGPDLLLSPVLDEGAKRVYAQFPPGIWYDWYTLDSLDGARSYWLDAPLTHIPLHIRGGAILPLKTPKTRVHDTYATPYRLLVALNETGQAHGQLYVDDGHSLVQPRQSYITFSFAEGALTASGTFGYEGAEALGEITLVGETTRRLSRAHFLHKDYSIVRKYRNRALVAGLQIPLTRPFEIYFS